MKEGEHSVGLKKNQGVGENMTVVICEVTQDFRMPLGFQNGEWETQTKFHFKGPT